jgi:hypothetical protein
VSGRGLCAVCDRYIVVRDDGTLRAHLARTSRPGQRETCDGSGMRPTQSEPPHAGRGRGMSRAAAFNAREEWSKADALYYDLKDMLELGAASPQAIEAERAALRRALADAEQLAPWWAVAPPADGVVGP